MTNNFDLGNMNQQIQEIMYPNYANNANSMVGNYGMHHQDSGNFIKVRNGPLQYLYDKSSNRFVHYVNDERFPIPNNQIPDGYYYYNSKNKPVVLKEGENITYKSTGFSISTK